MVFSSIIFLFYFLPLVLAVYYFLHCVAPRQVKHGFLTALSIIILLRSTKGKIIRERDVFCIKLNFMR